MIKEAITEAKTSLEGAGMKVTDYLPERINPTLAIISPSEPFVEEGLTFTSFKVSLDVVLVAGRASNEVSTTELYDLIETALFNLGDWTVANVQRPYQLEANGAYYLATTVSINQNMEIGGQ